MCGLVGIMSSNMFLKHKKCLSHLLYFDTIRGRDSTGVAAIRFNSDTAVLKQVVPGHDFIEYKEYEEHLKLNDFLWIGHNRYGTIGKNIKQNAHPFSILDEDGGCMLVGAHNGTLKNRHSLPDYNNFGTDSEAMFNSIADKGVKETIELLEGAWAVTYYDHFEDEFRFFRNKERPLHYAWEEGRKTLIWASESWMIRVACSRTDIKLENDKVYVVNEDTLYKVPAPEKMNSVLTIEREGGLVGKTFGFFQPTTTMQGDGGGTTTKHGGKQEAAERTQTQQQTAEKTTPETAAEKAAAEIEKSSPQWAKAQKGKKTLSAVFGTPPNKNGSDQQKKSKSSSTKQSCTGGTGKVVKLELPKTYKGYGGVRLTREEFEKQLADGCYWCRIEQITPEDRHAWVAEGRPICGKCLEGEQEDPIEHILLSNTIH